MARKAKEKTTSELQETQSPEDARREGMNPDDESEIGRGGEEAEDNIGLGQREGDDFDGEEAEETEGQEAEEEEEVIDEATGKPTDKNKPGWRSGRQTPIRE